MKTVTYVGLLVAKLVLLVSLLTECYKSLIEQNYRYTHEETHLYETQPENLP